MRLWLGLLVLVAGTACSTIDIRIVDERGVVVPGATVVASFEHNSYDKLLTDSEGRVRARGSKPHNPAIIDIEAANHYTSRVVVPMAQDCEERKCQHGTLDPLIVPIKRKANPVPMYHHDIRASPPDRLRPLGFDLVMADWVQPHGKGEVADLAHFQRCTIRNIQRFQAPTLQQADHAARVALGRDYHMMAERQIVGGRAELLPYGTPVAGFNFPAPEAQDGYEVFGVRKADRECKGEIRFDNPGDGLQFVPTAPSDQLKRMLFRSDLESDHLAPEAGYQAVWTYSSKNKPDYETPGHYNGEQVAYIRIRSKMEADGRIVSALFGKAYDMEPDFARLPHLIMDFYLNPDGTRNVEYDTQRNLGRDDTNKP
jgi:hypothetical protein